MKWLKRFFGQGGLDNPETGVQSSGTEGGSTEAGIVLTDERAMALSAVWSCVRLITETVGSLPIGVFIRTEDGRDKVDDHFLYNLLRVAPNALMSPLEFREAMTACVTLWGNAYAHISRNAKGEPIALMPLRPDRVTPTREVGTVTYHYRTSEKEHIYAKESILHIKGFGVDGIMGLSPLSYARHTMGISVAADRYASHSFSHNGRPAGTISVDKILTPEQRKELRAIYNNIEAGGTEILEAGLKYEAVGLPPDDMQMLQSRQFQLGEIARIFRVPSFLINDTEKSTSWGTGIEQQNLGFLTYTIRPYLTRWESAIAYSLLDRTQRRRYFVEHNVEGLLRADSAARAAFYSTAAQNGWMSRNEIRRKENLPPVDGGDDLTVQVNLTPVYELPRIGNGNQNPAG